MTATVLSLGDIFEQRYELLEVLGSGGAGVVYLARQLDADRKVAIKVFLAELARDDELKQRFFREAQVLCRIKHENVVAVHHLGLSSLGLPFIVMEHVAGKTLRAQISEQGALRIERSISIARQCASALIEVHSAGIVHRDLKPENIVFADENSSDVVKIIDFGLARVENSSEKQQVLTSTGFLIGTIAYMSPEQCRGNHADARSDIYALSLCFYEMLKGRPPFEADSTMGLMYKQINEALPPLDTRTFGAASEALNAFFKKGLAKDPDERFRNAEEMLAAIDDLVDTAGDALVAKKSIKREVLVVPGLILVTFMFLLLVGFKFVSSTPKRVEVLPAPKVNAGSFDDPRNDPSIKRVLDNPGVDRESKIQLLLHDAEINQVRALRSLTVAKALCSKPLRKSKEYLHYLVLRELGGQFLLIGDYQNALENFEPVLMIDGKDKLSAGFGNRLLQDTKAGAALSLFVLGKKERARKLVRELASYEGMLPLNESRQVMKVALGLQDNELVNKLMRAHGSATNSAHYALQFRKAKRYDLALQALRQAKTARIDTQFEEPDAVHFEIAAQEAELLCAQGNKARARQVLMTSMEGINVPLAIRHSITQVHFLHALKTAGLDLELLSYQPLDVVYEISLLKAEIFCARGKFEEARKIILHDAKKDFFPSHVKDEALNRIDKMKDGKLSKTSPLLDWSL